MNYILTVAALCALTLAACGDSANGENAVRKAESSDTNAATNLSVLPDDFPQQLIPPDFDSVEFVDMTEINGTRGAAFESSVDVQVSIEHYTGLLGPPALDVESGDGGRMAQWQRTPYAPWVVGVIGDAYESIVSVTAVPEG